jgi:hypothetical protein
MIDQDAAREALLTVTQAEQDMASIRVRRAAISLYMLGAYFVLACVFPMTIMGQSAFAAAPALFLLAFVCLGALVIWAVSGRSAARPLRVQFKFTAESIAEFASATTVGTMLLILLLPVIQQSNMMKLQNNISIIASYLIFTGVIVNIFMMGSGIGLFIWLGRYLALFGMANLLAMLCAIWFAATPDQALHWLIACAAVQFAAGVYLAKFQKPE